MTSSLTVDDVARLQAQQEPERHAAEVRYVATLPSRAARRNYLYGHGGVAELRGREAAERIVAELHTLASERHA